LDAAFFGSTVAHGHSGLESLPDVQLVNAGGSIADLDVFAEAISKAERVGATLTAFVMNPDMMLTLATLKVATDWNQPLLGIDPSSPTKRSAQGVPVHWSAAVPSGRIWGIPKAKVFAVLRLPVSVVTDRSAYFSSDRLGVRCVTRFGFAFPHQAAIIKIGLGGS
jgi:HK97 family phage major capsid protein